MICHERQDSRYSVVDRNIKVADNGINLTVGVRRLPGLKRTGKYAYGGSERDKNTECEHTEALAG